MIETGIKKASYHLYGITVLHRQRTAILTMFASFWTIIGCFAVVSATASTLKAPFKLNRCILSLSRLEAKSLTPIVCGRRDDGFPYPLDEVDKLYEASLGKFEIYLGKKNISSHGCTLETASRRREWYKQNDDVYKLLLTNLEGMTYRYQKERNISARFYVFNQNRRRLIKRCIQA